MSHDRITQVRISGLRAIDELTLDLHGLTVLIGDNGTGKSSILEAFEILHQVAKPIAHVSDIIVKGHGGLDSLLRRGSDELRLGVTIEGDGPQIVYDLSMGHIGVSPAVLREQLDVYADPEALEPLRVLKRKHASLTLFDARTAKLRRVNLDERFDDEESTGVDELRLALPWLRAKTQPALQRVVKALDQIDVHVPFEARPIWQQRALDIRQGPRWPSVVEKTDRLTRHGVNLPNAFQQLRNLGNETWSRVLERAQLGLGADLRDFRLSPSGRGNIELELVFGTFPDAPLPAEVLSEGQLSYLAFIALCGLHGSRSLLAFDDPEIHLHPGLLVRVLWMLEEVSASAPVIVATHSDSLLDALEDPARSVVLCELDEKRRTRLRRPDAARLAEWTEDDKGLGSLRADGYAAHVFGDVDAEGKGTARGSSPSCGKISAERSKGVRPS
ncbi:AAA family ATPase [Chondromyces crocatus]|uniref:ATPase AAA-type core domain-containing protein n=1 Tax=Chondromyces crocatus TaxID=52 RepID=A0A0K1EGA8_CHOCO|nr:AAA family ATPase [Chondromyces crocatus]AKT39608.1 uncharacterized protein CMC5_037570 [Chondromyces crocatus]